MQVDVSEENENAEEEPYIVENPTLVRKSEFIIQFQTFHRSVIWLTKVFSALDTLLGPRNLCQQLPRNGQIDTTDVHC